MRLYLDDDSASAVLEHHLQQAGHDVLVPADLGISGAADPAHLRHAVREPWGFLSHNQGSRIEIGKTGASSSWF